MAQRIARARRVSLTFGRIYLRIKTQQFIARRISPPDMAERWSRLHRESAESIYDLAVSLHGLILKGCQFLGARADVLPPEYVEVLSRLQDRVPPRSAAVARQVVESELGRPIEELFAYFSPRPVASASLAQVHEATLKTGERVAVKIQYPEIAALIRSDLANLKFLFRAVGLIERDFDLMPLMQELGDAVPRELDFVSEARSAETIAEFFAAREDVHVPRVHWAYTSRRVLVMEFIEGIKISDSAALVAAGIDRNQLMQTLIEAYCEQIFVRGLFHADPHPGNLIVQPRVGASPRLVFVDFGLTKDLPREFRQGFTDFAAALLQGRPDDMASALVGLGFETRDHSPESLTEIARLVLDIAGRLRHQAFMDPKVAREAARELPRMIRENPILRVPNHVVLLGRVIALLSGLGRALEAKVDMLNTILPYAVGLHRPGSNA